MFGCAWSSLPRAGFSLWRLLLQHRLGAHRLQRLWHISLVVVPHRLSCLPCCRKGDPSQGLNVGSCLTLRNELSEETHVLTKQEILLGRVPRWRAVGWGSRGGLLPLLWLPVLGFMVMEVVSTLPLANHSDSLSQEGFWEVVGHVVSPFDLVWSLPVGGGLLVPCFLLGPPVVKHLMQVVTRCLARVGGFRQHASPNTLRVGPSWTRDWTMSPAIAGGFSSTEPPRKSSL